MSKTVEKLHELRDTAERLILGEPNARWLRGLFVELVGALLGDHQNHPDVEATGARYAAPTFQGSIAAPPVAGLAATAHAVAPPGAPGSPASPIRRPAAAPLTLADGAAIAAARKAQAAALATEASSPAEPVNGAADPAGPGFLGRLEQRVAAENEGSE
jgi:hypothetical protein